MLSKDELLQKGIDPALADEIVASYAQGDTSTPLVALEKALKKGTEGSEEAEKDLFKADDNDEDDKKGKKEDDAEDYDEAYMKKHMSRFMKENKSACKKAFDEAHGSAEVLEKAISNIDMTAEGAVVEMADLTECLKAFSDFANSTKTYMQELNKALEVLSSQSSETYGLLHKASSVTLNSAKAIDSFLDVPQGRKGAKTTELQKAIPVSAENAQIVYKVLQKAVMNRDKRAGMIASVFESAGKRIDVLNASDREYINELIQKEAK